MIRQIIIIGLFIVFFLSAMLTYAQTDSLQNVQRQAEIQKNEKQAAGIQKTISKSDKKIRKAEKKQRRQEKKLRKAEKKAERNQKKKDRQMNKLQEKQGTIDELKRQPTTTP